MLFQRLPSGFFVRFLLSAVLLLAVSACGGDSAPERHTVRGIYVGPKFDGEAASIDHEAIPNFMDAMQMDFKFGEGATPEGVEPGDKIQFDLVLTDDDYWIENLQPLPDTTTLRLAGR